MTEHDLESLYREVQSALKSRDYVRASELLRQILVVDENYKDVSRLLAQTVKLKRRRWYNHPILWGALGFVIIVALGSFIAPRLKGLYVAQPSAPVIINSPTATLPPTAIATATETPLPVPTSIPLTWKRVSIGQEFERDKVTAFVIDPKDQDVLYVGMKNAGIYKSIDGGLSWRPAHQGLSNTQVTSLLIDSQNPRILYAGTIDSIFKTEDGGENWYRIAEGTHLLMNPQNSSHLYARDEDNIYETTNQGIIWEIVYSLKEGCLGKIYSWTINPVDGNILVVAGSEGCESGIHLSNDGGRTWLLLMGYTDPSWIDTLVVGLDRQGEYYIFTGAGMQHNEFGIWRTLLDVGLPATFDSGELVYFYCNPHLCKFNLEEKQNVTLGKPEVERFASITISPYDPNTIYVAGEGLSVSKDGGMTWTKLNNGLGSGKLQLDTSSEDKPVLYLQSGECEQVFDPEHRAFQDDAGQPFFISRDGGQNWNLSIRTGCHLLKDSAEPILYRVGQQWIWSTNTTHYLSWLWWSRDQGNTWQTKYVTDVVPPFTVVAHTFQSGVLYAYSSKTHRSPGYGGAKTYISEDYGSNWETEDATGIALKPCYGSTLQFIDAYRPVAIDPFDGDHVFVIDNGALLESHDSCDTTETFATPPNTSMNSIAFDPNNSGTIYAGTDGGAYISIDGGQSWGQINDGLLGATVVYSIVVDTDNNVYAATPYGVFKLEGK